MAFRPVFVYDDQGTFLGYSIKKDGADKLHTANLWTDSDEDRADFQEQLNRLVDNVDVRAFWPDVRDPAVQVVLADPNFEPLALSPVEVVDEDKSIFVWIEEPNDENPFGKMDEDKSIIVMKTEMAPAPAHVTARVKRACEVVARQRAEAAQND